MGTAGLWVRLAVERVEELGVEVVIAGSFVQID
jgi:hypothetical protein